MSSAAYELKAEEASAPIDPPPPLRRRSEVILDGSCTDMMEYCGVSDYCFSAYCFQLFLVSVSLHLITLRYNFIKFTDLPVSP